jgi:hypothetical protein
MNPKQKRIVGILAIANVVVILILVTLTTRPTLHSRAHTPTPTHPTHPTLPPDNCQWQATQLLAQAGLSGIVMLTTDGPLTFEITYPLAPDQTTDDAAQETWTAFDIALALHEQGCPTFTQVQVTILTNHSQINASVSTSDLIAFGAEELSQDKFIERVTYTHSTTHDE